MKETSLRIRLLGDPCLRKRASCVKRITDRHRDILSGMSQLMYAASGVGLAAPQVGINEAMIVVDIGFGLYKLINPKILEKEGTQVNQEGCLSVPGVCVKVKRAENILVEAEGLETKKIIFEADGLFACVLQHEIEHLKGKLIVDYVSFMEKLKLKRKLEEVKKKSKND
jgi:peptide deformylase